MRSLPLLAISLVFAGAVTACSPGNDAVLHGPAGPNGVGPNRLSTLRGWMSPDVRRKTALLYVSDVGANLVDVFSVPGYKRVGQITKGIDEPEGLAVDQKGSLYVPNYKSGTVTVYKHGATSPSLTLSIRPAKPHPVRNSPVPISKRFSA
jgi:DNA-binding beta-propeller fold protein YncE